MDKKYKETIDKIEWLIDNEGSELSDGYSGLKQYFSYCCDDLVKEKIIEVIREDVDDNYDVVFSDYKEYMENKSVPNEAADLIWSRLCGMNGIYFEGLDEGLENEIKGQFASLMKIFTN